EQGDLVPYHAEDVVQGRRPARPALTQAGRPPAAAHLQRQVRRDRIVPGNVDLVVRPGWASLGLDPIGDAGKLEASLTPLQCRTFAVADEHDRRRLFRRLRHVPHHAPPSGALCSATEAEAQRARVKISIGHLLETCPDANRRLGCRSDSLPCWPSSSLGPSVLRHRPNGRAARRRCTPPPTSTTTRATAPWSRHRTTKVPARPT